MTTLRRVYQVDVFTRERMAGNPAGVVANADGLTPGEMQRIARELNNSETAFLFPPEADDHDVRIRFFTPTLEVPSCGHATIASHYVRAVEGIHRSGPARHRIGIGTLDAVVTPMDDDFRVEVRQAAPVFGPVISVEQREEVARALGVDPSAFDRRCAMRVVDTGHSKLMIGLEDTRTLDGLTPDASRLIALSRVLGCAGYFVFVLGAPADDPLTHARMFAPQIGVPEDPVTGNGNGPLGAYLVSEGLAAITDGEFRFRSRQGEAMGRPGTAHVRISVANGKPAAVRVAGDAVVVFRTEIAL